jgi:hypothetical protein
MPTGWGRMAVAGASLCGMLALAGCGFGTPAAAPSPTVSSSSAASSSVAPSSPSAPSSSAASSSSASSPSPASYSGSSSASSSGPARCLSGQLSVSLVGSSLAAGSVVNVYEFTNNRSSACTLYGYPGLQMLSAGGQALSTTVVRQPATQVTVLLQAGGHAWFSLQFPDATGYGGLTCPKSAALEITPPNAYHYLTLTGTAGAIQPYGGTTTDLQCGHMTVQPVTATAPNA